MPRGPDFHIKPRVRRAPPLPLDPHSWEIDCQACDMINFMSTFARAQRYAADHEAKPTQNVAGRWMSGLRCTPETRFQRGVERQITLMRPILERLADQ